MPIFKNIQYRDILRHGLFWLAYILYQAVVYKWADVDELRFEFPPQVIGVSVPVTIAVTYINLQVLMPRLYNRRRYILYGLFFLLLIISGGTLVRTLTHYLILPWEQVHNPARYAKEVKHLWIPIRIIRLALEISIVAAITMMFRLMRDNIRHEKHLRQVEKEKFTAELNLLKAQVNPHFLFNTFNSLYALTLDKSDLAPNMVLRLSQLMHYMLYSTANDEVPLNDEINYLRDYISIEQTRFGNRVEVSFQCAGLTGGVNIAPLLLLPFVENTFKHGVEEGSGWITINLNYKDGQLFFKVENSYTNKAIPNKPGIGLVNVQQRLKLLYPNRHTLRINKNDESFEAELKIDL
ncbi:histidine kinase [Mucilaginibacter sp. CAU 1740]|uniref:sensor histidine kinase n=1 Tax=Mucilaginibacter sp. CAU 1740 TaxID=3140365 RepID=UPI00325B584F